MEQFLNFHKIDLADFFLQLHIINSVDDKSITVEF